MDRILAQFFNAEVAAQYLPSMASGFAVTLGLAALIVVTGLSGGLALAVARTFQLRAVTFAIVAYADILRCLPPLTLMFMFYFAFPLAGISMSGMTAAWLALSLVLAAFSEEIFWTAFLSINKGQWEAARSTGLSFGQTISHVILPQAMRVAIPSLTNRTIAITKGVALASAVAVPEMLGEAIAATSYSSNSTPLLMAAAGYMIIFLPLAIFSRRLETRFRWN
ncbi:amino acid ABC transporter permease [Oricola indica]|jgi:polar amino acid transport system permease protein|uniref:amino acid ABC transporter permease n=1 Tax=Oricola indica TaxID=2872591 RepID=UPI001CC1B889|nr:amino acid ABC transporter permease [Oricola indica]